MEPRFKDNVRRAGKRRELATLGSVHFLIVLLGLAATLIVMGVALSR